MDLKIEASLTAEDRAEITELKVMLSMLLQQKNEEVWITDEMVAERFKVSKQTIYRWIKAESNRMPFCQFGDVRRYCLKEVDEWFMKFSEKNILKLMNKKLAA